MSAKFVSWEEAVLWLIDQPDKQDLVRDCYYDASVFDAAERYFRSDEWNAVAEFLPEPGRALDLGAGRGISSYALAKSGWKVTAIEPDLSDLVGAGAIEALAREASLPIVVNKTFGEQIACDNETFDLVFARQVLHHANDLEQLCRELFRVLKPGGKLIAVRDHVISKTADLEKFQQIHPLHYLYGGENAYKKTEYVNALTDAGFKVSVVMGSFESVINYAPYTRQSLRAAIQSRIQNVPGGKFLGQMFENERLFSWTLNLMNILDRRPGRLYSFICEKSGL